MYGGRSGGGGTWVPAARPPAFSKATQGRPPLRIPELPRPRDDLRSPEAALLPSDPADIAAALRSKLGQEVAMQSQGAAAQPPWQPSVQQSFGGSAREPAPALVSPWQRGGTSALAAPWQSRRSQRQLAQEAAQPQQLPQQPPQEEDLAAMLRSQLASRPELMEALDLAAQQLPEANRPAVAQTADADVTRRVLEAASRAAEALSKTSPPEVRNDNAEHSKDSDSAEKPAADTGQSSDTKASATNVEVATITSHEATVDGTQSDAIVDAANASAVVASGSAEAGADEVSKGDADKPTIASAADDAAEPAAELVTESREATPSQALAAHAAPLAAAAVATATSKPDAVEEIVAAEPAGATGLETKAGGDIPVVTAAVGGAPVDSSVNGNASTTSGAATGGSDCIVSSDATIPPQPKHGVASMTAAATVAAAVPPGGVAGKENGNTTSQGRAETKAIVPPSNSAVEHYEDGPVVPVSSVTCAPEVYHFDICPGDDIGAWFRNVRRRIEAELADDCQLQVIQEARLDLAGDASKRPQGSSKISARISPPESAVQTAVYSLVIKPGDDLDPIFSGLRRRVGAELGDSCSVQLVASS
eukprot:TRINITY_DN3292_c0_g1_i1.p1 TRINITY_DN3292_c0_g1~~TRINITY_DN3292_c0_g1_i1.p1  ORF type:complete len:592 (+),score=132.17 TRINITY_DN3292_c0_g1_i1:109-1884(+)